MAALVVAPAAVLAVALAVAVAVAVPVVVPVAVTVTGVPPTMAGDGPLIVSC